MVGFDPMARLDLRLNPGNFGSAPFLSVTLLGFMFFFKILFPNLHIKKQGEKNLVSVHCPVVVVVVVVYFI